jgi:hypothetical protein
VRGAQRLFFGTHAFEILDFAHSLERRIASTICSFQFATRK